MSFPSLAAIKVVYSLMNQGLTQPVSSSHPSKASVWLIKCFKLMFRLEELIGHLYFQLKTLTPHLKQSAPGAALLQLPDEIPQSPIFAILTPEPRSLARYCQDAGFVVRPIVPPTATSRVRVCLHAGNTFNDVERLVSRIRQWLDLRVTRRSDGPLSPNFLKSAL